MCCTECHSSCYWLFILTVSKIFQYILPVVLTVLCFTCRLLCILLPKIFFQSKCYTAFVKFLTYVVNFKHESFSTHSFGCFASLPICVISSLQLIFAVYFAFVDEIFFKPH